jgi:hypothetical protein
LASIQLDVLKRAALFFGDIPVSLVDGLPFSAPTNLKRLQRMQDGTRALVVVSFVLCVALPTSAAAMSKNGSVVACNFNYESMSARELKPIADKALADANVEHSDADATEIAASAQQQLKSVRTPTFSKTACNKSGDICVAFACD